MLLIKVFLTAELTIITNHKIMSKVDSKICNESVGGSHWVNMWYITHLSVDAGFLCLSVSLFLSATWLEIQKKNVFKLLKIGFLQKTFLVHGRIFTKWESLVLCTLKAGILFFLLDPTLSAIFFHKRTSFVRPGSLLRWGTLFFVHLCKCTELFLCYSHSSHFAIVQTSVGPGTYGNISFIKSSKTILFTVLTWPSDSQNLVSVSWTNMRLIDGKLWDCSFSLRCVSALCHF